MRAGPIIQNETQMSSEAQGFLTGLARWWGGQASNRDRRFRVDGVGAAFGQGEASGVALASHLLAAYRAPATGQNTSGSSSSWQPLRARSPDRAARCRRFPADARLDGGSAVCMSSPSRAVGVDPTDESRAAGTGQLVAMREDLLTALDEIRRWRPWTPISAPVRLPGSTGASSTLQRIDWSTPAPHPRQDHQYEGVHAITSWDDLRLRLNPPTAAASRSFTRHCAMSP